jgi:predicted DCC family thiol-disulfide oxidoreductase YuxK
VLEREVLIYDGDCAFCQRCLEWGQRTLPSFPQALSYASIQPAHFGLELDDVQQSIWLVAPEASIQVRQMGHAQWSGHRAAARILTQQPLKSRFGFGWRMFGYLIILGGPLSALIYRLVANNRQRMPGGTESCALPTTDSKTSQND